MKNVWFVLRLVTLVVATATLSAQMINQPQMSAIGGVGGAPAQQIQQSIYQFIKSSPQTSRVSAHIEHSCLSDALSVTCFLFIIILSISSH